MIFQVEILNLYLSIYYIINLPYSVNGMQEGSNSIHLINSKQIESIDLNTNDIIGAISLYDKPTNPIKISSDCSLVEPNVVAAGMNSDLFICDTLSQKITTHIPNVHFNSVLSIEYNPLNPFILCTTGTDYSVKFWDIRKPQSEVGGIYNNTHWVWSCKYNRNYSNMLVTASSSSLVRNIIFNKQEEIEDTSIEINSHQNLGDYSFIDYFEFEDSVYATDWLRNDSWTFVAVSYNSYFHVNTIPEDIKYKVML